MAGDRNAILNLVDFIMNQRKVSVILTMRAADAPGTKAWIKLGGESGLPPLKLDQARQAFMLISNSHEENIETLDWMLTQLDGMPLAILLIAQLRRKNLALKFLVKEWKNHILKNGGKESKLTSVAISIELSLRSLENESAECKRLLPILSYLPNGLPMWQEQLDKLFSGFKTTVQESVISLLDFALIYQEAGTLKMLAPIQEYIQMKYPAQEEDLNYTGRYYVELLKDCQLIAGRGQSIIELHIANIVKVVGTQIQSKADEKYIDACQSVCEYSKFFSMTVSLIDMALGQNWRGKQEKKIELRFDKVYILTWMGYFAAAKAEVEKIQLSLRNIKYNLPEKIKMRFEMKCLQDLGYILMRENIYTEAKTMLLKAKSGFEAIGSQLGAAQCLRSLARAKLLEAKSAFETIGSQLGAAQCLQSLGEISLMENKYPEARAMLLEAKSAFETIGDQLGAAQCLRILGAISHAETS
ncbi:hypothetical protein GYMLUDRAFT_47245 [Collybiopsis luxurians FD-317 M1]|uniref:Uncharacterized protein n=1 Tax=Collybiopsis luxurians FD-317 M1 TaxID=944289 RepID=A0A0D0C1J5_9AGAR|nr:hypothetical protein GYMLUDRAFT_47245 [Collybiopsis luxurians FD-317 M1]